MPIYAYKCESCGHRQDVLQKMSDPVLSVCPACGAASFAKQLTAAGFQLKGSGWYATDFKGDKKAPASDDKGEAKPEAKPDAKPADAAKPSPAPATSAAPAPATEKPKAPTSDAA